MNFDRFPITQEKAPSKDEQLVELSVREKGLFARFSEGRAMKIVAALSLMTALAGSLESAYAADVGASKQGDGFFDLSGPAKKGAGNEFIVDAPSMSHTLDTTPADVVTIPGSEQQGVEQGQSGTEIDEQGNSKHRSIGEIR